MRLSTTICISFSIRSNNRTILSSPVCTSTSPSSQPSVLPTLSLHFYNISVKSTTRSSGSLSTLLQHLRQVNHRFFRLSLYTSTTSPLRQPPVLPALSLHFYNISVKSTTGSSGSLSTLIHLRQVSPRFFRLSVYTSTTSPSSQPPVLSSLYLHHTLHRQISPH